MESANSCSAATSSPSRARSAASRMSHIDSKWVIPAVRRRDDQLFVGGGRGGEVTVRFLDAGQHAQPVEDHPVIAAGPEQLDAGSGHRLGLFGSAQRGQVSGGEHVVGGDVPGVSAFDHQRERFGQHLLGGVEVARGG